MADAVASVSLRADLRDLTKALTSATGLTEGAAQKMVIALEKSFQRAEKASKAASAAMVKAANQEQAAWLAEVDAMNAAIDAEAERVKAVERATAAEKARLATLESIPESIRKAAALEIQSTAALKAKADAIGITTQRYLALEQAELDAAQATAATTKTVTTAKVSYGNLFAQLADIGKGLASGTSPLTILTQQGEQVAFALSQAGGATAVFKAGLAAILPFAPHIAAITVAVAALGYAWHEATKELDAANAKMEASAQAAQDAQDAYEDLAKVKQDTTDKWLVATGKATDKDLELRDAVQSITASYGPRIKAEQDALKAAREGAATAHAAMTQQNATGDAVQKAANEWRAGTAAAEQHERELAALTEQQGVYLQRAAIGILTVKDETEGRKKHTKAIKDEKDALQEENDLAAKNAAIYRSALNDIDAMSFGLKKNKTDVENLSDAYHANLEAIKASEMEALAVVSGNADAEYTARHAALLKSIEAQAAYYRDVEALQEASERAAEDAAREAAKRAADLAARQTAIFEDGEKDRKDIAIAYAAAGASIAGSVGDAFALAQQNMTGLSKKEAAILFRVTQAAQLAQALLLTPAAILQGLAQAGPAGGIAAGIAAGVQVAAIAAAKPPSFRQGTSGYFGAPTGEKTITAHVGEGEGIAVVSRQGMANSRAEGVDARNAGLSGGSGGPLSVNLTMSGRVVGRVMVDASRGASGRSAVQAAAKSSFTNPYRRAA